MFENRHDLCLPQSPSAYMLSLGVSNTSLGSLYTSRPAAVPSPTQLRRPSDRTPSEESLSLAARNLQNSEVASVLLVLACWKSARSAGNSADW